MGVIGQFHNFTVIIICIVHVHVQISLNCLSLFVILHFLFYFRPVFCVHVINSQLVSIFAMDNQPSEL